MFSGFGVGSTVTHLSDVKAGLLTFSFQQRRLCVCVYLNVCVCVCVCMGYSIIYHSIYHSVSGERIQAQSPSADP